MIKLVSLLVFAIVSHCCSAQTLTLENLSAKDRQSKEVLLGFITRFQIRGDDHFIEIKSTGNGIVYLDSTTLVVKPSNVGEIKVVFTTSKNKYEFVFMAKYPPKEMLNLKKSTQ